MSGTPKKPLTAGPPPDPSSISATFASRGAARSLVLLATVERDTGLSRQTLRDWERRFGFPLALRDASGERACAGSDLHKLRLIKQLLDRGHLPAEVVPLPIAALQQLAGDAAAAVPAVSTLRPPGATGERGSAGAAEASTESAVDMTTHLALLRTADPAALRAVLRSSLQQSGVARFIAEVAAPLNAAVGDAWMRGHLAIHEEHACTESLQVLMREAIASLPPPPAAARPRVLLSSFSGEPHALGLLMAEAMLTLQGCACISLGVQTPAWDLSLAAAAYRIDIVALSFSGCLDPQQTIEHLTGLRRRLPPAVELWAGGSAPVLHRRPIDGVWAPGGFGPLPQRLADWRARAVAAS